ncbi:MAG: hypothetical protein ACYCVE_05085 [Gemmatimonadaceae bacterium]
MATVALALSSAATQAQTSFVRTRFMWPDTAVDVAAYPHVDLCTAAEQRVDDNIRNRGWQVVWRDTMPADPRARLEPLPPLVIATAKSCSARYDARTAPLSDFAPLFKLYLDADRQADASTILARRLQAAARAAIAVRAAVMDTAFEDYLKGQPSRLDSAEALLHRWPTKDRLSRFPEYAMLTLASFAAADTVRMMRAGMQTLGIADSLTPAEKASPGFQHIANLGNVSGTWLLGFILASQIILNPMPLDSLRQSTAAFGRALESLWPMKLLGRYPHDVTIIGQKAPRILADYWSPPSAASVVRPTPGRVSLVNFLNRPDCLDGDLGMMSDGRPAGSNHCFEMAAILHRLQAAFPELEIITITRTRGFFNYVTPPTPAREDSLIERNLRDYKYPGTIAIQHTPYWNIVTPDGRRIDSPSSNFVTYAMGAGQPLTDGAVFIVDQNGEIVRQVVGGVRSQLPYVERIIQILLDRQAGRSGSAKP